MSQTFIDSLMGLVKSSREKDGARTARANLQQAWDYPSITAALPWRYYDDVNDLFINEGSAGFILEARRCRARTNRWWPHLTICCVKNWPAKSHLR